jgi:hypothetical protein
MFAIKRDVYVNGQKVGVMEIVFETEQVTVTAHRESGPAVMLELSHGEADSLYDLMTMAHPAYKKN